LTELPYRPGQFVWCMFPFTEAPLRPGPQRHIGYVLDIVQRRGRLCVAVLLYTTTRAWPRDTALPAGVVRVQEKQAAVGQRPFLLDARRIAYMPVDRTFFPELNNPGRGVQGTASIGFQRHVERVLAALLEQPELLELLGPERPQRRR
jgi:hypothetical protein